MDAYFAFGQFRDGEIREYPDREAIEQGYLDGRDLEIAYARSLVDVFFAHVQGAARLVYPTDPSAHHLCGEDGPPDSRRSVSF